MKDVIVIGAGLAGSEATYQLAKRGYNVFLYEMRPVKYSKAHITINLPNLFAVIRSEPQVLKMQ